MRFVRFDPAPALAGVGIVGVRDSGSLALGLQGPVVDAEAALESLFGPAGPEARRRDRYGVLALLAAREALAEAGLTDAARRSERCGVMIGTTHASSERNGRYAEDLATGASALSPSLFVRTTSGAAAADVAFAFRMGGPGQTFVSGWTAGAEALVAAARAVAAGAADLMLAGGVEVPGPIFVHAGPFTMEAAAIAVVARDAPPQRPRLLAYGRGRGTDGVGAILAGLARECGIECRVLVEANDPGSESRLRRAAPPAAADPDGRSRLSVLEHAGAVGAAGAVIGCALSCGIDGPALVVARDPAGDVAALVLDRSRPGRSRVP